MRDVKETHPLSDTIGIYIPPNESTSIWAVLNRLGRIFRERPTANQPQKVPLPENRQPSREEIMLSLEQINLSVSDFTNFVDNSFRGYLKGRCDNFRAGCVSDSLQAWEQLRTDREILCTVSGVSIDSDFPPSQYYLHRSFRTKLEVEKIDSEIAKLLLVVAIAKYELDSQYDSVQICIRLPCLEPNRSFSLSRNKKINRKPSSGKSQEFEML